MLMEQRHKADEGVGKQRHVFLHLPSEVDGYGIDKGGSRDDEIAQWSAMCNTQLVYSGFT